MCLPKPWVVPATGTVGLTGGLTFDTEPACGHSKPLVARWQLGHLWMATLALAPARGRSRCGPQELVSLVLDRRTKLSFQNRVISTREPQNGPFSAHRSSTPLSASCALEEVVQVRRGKPALPPFPPKALTCEPLSLKQTDVLSAPYGWAGPLEFLITLG